MLNRYRYLLSLFLITCPSNYGSKLSLETRISEGMTYCFELYGGWCTRSPCSMTFDLLCYLLQLISVNNFSSINFEVKNSLAGFGRGIIYELPSS